MHMESSLSWATHLWYEEVYQGYAVLSDSRFDRKPGHAIRLRNGPYYRCGDPISSMLSVAESIAAEEM